MRALALVFAMALPWLSPAALAGELVAGYQKALAADPFYQSALAEYEVNKIGAERAGRAYWPELAFKSGQRTEVRGSQTTIQIAQPLVDADRYATWRGAEPLEIRAAATMRQREADLLQRYYKAVLDLVRAAEQLRLSKAKIEALQNQSVASARGLALGTGTRTDVYDTEVRLALARADALTLQTTLEAADRQYQALTGEPPPKGFELAREKRVLIVQSLETMIRLADTTNPQVITALQAERLAELEVTRKYGAFLPRLNAIAKHTRASDGLSGSYVGVAIDFPLQSGSLLDVTGAKAGLAKTTADVVAARLKSKLEVQRLHALVVNGSRELPIRLEGVEAAKLGLEASEKSFKGGVRTLIDVLNSIQTAAVTVDDYVAAVLNLGTNFVALQALVDTRPVAVLEQLEKFLF